MAHTPKETQLIEEILSSRRVENIYPSREILKKTLERGTRPTFYLGIDPTSPALHLGHSVGLLVARTLQDLGCRIIILIGDFTGQVGDPTGRSGARPMLSHNDTKKNAHDYKRQISPLIRFTGTNAATIRFNSEWLSKLTFGDLIAIARHFTSNQMLKRDMFQQRIKSGKEIYLNEFLYPLMQGYDSVALDTDGEIGGVDQTFNMLIGRDLIKIFKKREKFVITTHLLVNPKTGEKLSKTSGNYIALSDPAHEMYGKAMALPDEFILPCFSLCTARPLQEIKILQQTLTPKDFKARLAHELVSMYHSVKAAQRAENEFSLVFTKRGAPRSILTVRVDGKNPPTIAELLVTSKTVASKSDAKRLISQGAIERDGVVITDWRGKIEIATPVIFKVGKHKFFKATPK